METKKAEAAARFAVAHAKKDARHSEAVELLESRGLKLGDPHGHLL